MKVKIVLEEGGIMPKKATPGAAAYDLYVPKDIVVNCGRNIIPLGFRIEMEYGYESKIEPRSGFSSKGMEGYPLLFDDGSTEYVETPERFNADVLIGKIDADYRGVCGVIIQNHGDPFVLPSGTRIAQLTFYKVEIAEWDLVESLGDTERGEGGFGHTGTN